MEEAAFHGPKPFRTHFADKVRRPEEGDVFFKAPKGDNASKKPEDIPGSELAVLKVLKDGGENGLNSMEIKRALKGTEFPVEIRDVPTLIQSVRNRFGEGLIVFKGGNYEVVLEAVESFPEKVRNVLGIDS